MKRDPDEGEVMVLFRGRGVVQSWPARLEEAQRQRTVRIEGRELPRIRYGDEGRGWGSSREPCHDCAAIRGELHVRGCDMERCPACGAQAISCGCLPEEEDRV